MHMAHKMYKFFMNCNIQNSLLIVMFLLIILHKVLCVSTRFVKLYYMLKINLYILKKKKT
jgi:hypothetical protein